jgi:magnesium-transporting ATPase (P-type)
VVLIDSFLRERIEIAIEQLASSALRTIGLAYRDLTGFEDVTTKDTKGVY